MKKIGEKKKFIIATVLFAAYLIFNGILLAGHELWRDEANVWLIARDMTPFQLLREIKYQGHPCLWYFMVMPFAKTGFPFETISVLSFLVMSLTAGVFVYRAPFHMITKAVCLFSPAFSYYYSVIARNYCLIALLLILLAYCYPKRNEKSILYGLLLGLLVQADTIALAAAGLISCMWLWECVHKSIKENDTKPLFAGAKGLWIPLASLGLWILQFSQVSDSPEYRMRDLGLGEMVSEMKSFSYHILTRMTGRGETFCLFLILLFLIAGVLLSLKIKNVWPVVVMAGAFLFEVVFSILVYQLHIWHYIALCFTLIWCFWLGYRSGDLQTEMQSQASTGKLKVYVAVIGRAFAELLLVALSITMFIRWNSPEEGSSLLNALNGLYSDGVHVAEFIESNMATDEIIVMTDVVEASTVQAYLGRDYKFYFAGNRETKTYANYTEDERTGVTYKELLSWVKNAFPGKENFYLLVSPTNYVEEITDEEKVNWELCYRTQEKTARGEEYSLYKISIP